MKATLRSMVFTTLAWGLFVTPLWGGESGIRLDNFWSDGPISVFLYETPHEGLEPDNFYARHDLHPGQVAEVAIEGRDAIWADVRVMHADGQRWLMSSESCGYRRAFEVHPGQTVEVAYERGEGYADSSAGMNCRVLNGHAFNP